MCSPIFHLKKSCLAATGDHDLQLGIHTLYRGPFANNLPVLNFLYTGKGIKNNN